MPSLKLPTIFFFHFGPLSFNLAFSLRKKTKSILLPIWPQKDQFKRNKKGLNTKSFLRKEKKTLWILVENIYDF
jgi:hypothetical protein